MSKTDHEVILNKMWLKKYQGQTRIIQILDDNFKQAFLYPRERVRENVPDFHYLENVFPTFSTFSIHGGVPITSQ